MPIYDTRIYEIEQQLKTLQRQRDELAKRGRIPSVSLEADWTAKRTELIQLVAEYEK